MIFNTVGLITLRCVDVSRLWAAVMSFSSATPTLTFEKAFRGKHTNLALKVDTSHGLWNQLLDREVLTGQQISTCQVLTGLWDSIQDLQVDAVALRVEHRTSDWEVTGSLPARALLAHQPYASYSHPCASVTKHYTVNQKIHQNHVFLIYSLQNQTNCDGIWYILSVQKCKHFPPHLNSVYRTLWNLAFTFCKWTAVRTVNPKHTNMFLSYLFFKIRPILIKFGTCFLD